MIGRLGHLDEGQLPDLHLRIDRDRQVGHVRQLERDVPVPTGVDEAGRRVDQEAEPAQGALPFQSRDEIVGQLMINEDSETHSAHNLNVDAFNVHTKDLGYFQSQTITFIANKNGTFPYYCTIHPEMKGLIHVSE